MSRNSNMLDSAFLVMGQAASYTPSGGPTVTISVIPSQDDQNISFGQTKIRTGKAVFEVRRSQLASPARGAVVVFNGDSFTVKDFRIIDEDRLLWLLECYEA